MYNDITTKEERLTGYKPYTLNQLTIESTLMVVVLAILWILSIVILSI